MFIDSTILGWFGLGIFQLFIAIYFLNNFHKNKDKRHLMFGLAFFIISYSHFHEAIIAPFIIPEPITTLKIQYWSFYPLVFAIGIAIHENFLKIKDIDFIFKLFIGLSLISFIIIFFNPIQPGDYAGIFALTCSMEILIIAGYNTLKNKGVLDLIFLLSLICISIGGYTLSLYDYELSIFSFFIGNILIVLALIIPKINLDFKKSTIIEYLTLKKELQDTKSILEEKERNFQTLFNQMVDPVMILDKKGKFLELTDRIKDHMGYDKSEILGKNFMMTKLLTPKSKVICLKNLMKRVRGEEIKPYEVEAVTKNGVKKPYEVNAERIIYKGKTADMVVFRDISERKKAEKEILSKNEELRIINKVNASINYGKNLEEVIKIIGTETGKLFNSHNATIYLLSNDKKKLITKITGLSINELKTVKKITGMDIINKDINLYEGSKYTKIVHEKKPLLINDSNEILEFIKSYSEKKYLKKFAPIIKKALKINSMMSVPLISKGECIGIIDISRSTAFNEDDLNRFSRIADQLSIAINKIHNDKEIEKTHKKLKEFNKELEQRVRDRTIAVEKLLKQKDYFINQLSHDLKNPLNPLINLVPILEKDEKDPQRKEMYDVINRNLEYMKNLVFKTIKLAKLNSPNTKFYMETLNFSDLIDDIIKQNKYIFEEKNITLKKSVSSDLIINVDKLHFNELLNNLLNNAVKYSKGPGVIEINCFTDKKNATFSIKDNGIGMTEDQIDQIFDEFYKADISRHDINSSGLGLTICKRIVEKHGGTIWAESEGLGKGCTFNFTIPFSQKNDYLDKIDDINSLVDNLVIKKNI